MAGLRTFLAQMTGEDTMPPTDGASPPGSVVPPADDAVPPAGGPSALVGGAGSLVKGGVAGLAGAVVNAASQFLIVVALTRGLHTGTAGALFTATTLCLMVAGILRLDSGNGLIYFIARSRRHGQQDISRYFRTALVPVIVLSIVTAVIVIVCADTIAAALVPTHATAASGSAATGTASSAVTAASGSVTAVLGSALRVLGVALPVIVCADVLVCATRGFGSMRPTALLSGVLQPGAQLVLVGAVALTGAATGLSWALPAAWAVPALPVLILSALWLRRRMPAEPYVTGTRGSDAGETTGPDIPGTAGPYVGGTAGEFWRYVGPRALGGAVQAVFQRLDIVIVAVLAGPEEAALYTAATRFKVVGQLVNQGLTQAVQPRLIRALAEGDLSLARKLYQTTTMWLIALTWPLWLGYAALAPWLLRVFGDGYRHGAAVAAVLAATMMLATACGMADVVLIAAGHTASSMVNILGAIAVTTALDVVLVPAHGAFGAVLGWSGGVLAKNLLPLFQIARRYELRPFGVHSLPSLRPWLAEEAT
ncbi:polysaccharide biosynthesis C-terminal domain-containing protein [Sphaerisporangium sp. NPDC088356]|uniref:lipopolysaccharide biosynthesis protein n=1 Tax=Sphaerisporangium sp. NPDC088356 TaxID=3154871 RepID=UPI00342E1C83